jgi:hypothetical protein
MAQLIFLEIYLKQNQSAKCSSLMELVEQMQAAAVMKSDPFVIVSNKKYILFFAKFSI